MPASPLHHKLQAMPIKVLEVNAMRVPRTTTDCYAVLLQLGFEPFVRAGLHVEGQMVKIVARGQGGITLLFEQSYSLVATVQKCLGGVFPVDAHAQDFGVELLSACHVLHMQDD